MNIKLSIRISRNKVSKPLLLKEFSTPTMISNKFIHSNAKRKRIYGKSIDEIKIIETPKENKFQIKRLITPTIVMIIFIFLFIIFISPRLFISNGKAVETYKTKKINKLEMYDKINNSLEFNEKSTIEDARINSSSIDNEVKNDVSEDGKFYFNINRTVHFDSVNDKGHLLILNPSKSDFYIQVVIKEDTTDKEMYVSKIIAPGDIVSYDYLTNKEYITGSYEANVYFNYYSTEDEDSYVGQFRDKMIIKIGIES